MEKKYELIKEGFNWPRVKALKDFTLITGEKVKKGDIGGCVKLKDNLSQEGNCWIMDDVFVEGKVSGNAVIKDYAFVEGEVSENAIVKGHARVYGKASGNAVIQDYAKIYGEVSGNALVKDDTEVSGKVSGNTIVKDFAEVRENATVTGNAVVQASQEINYGTVTTDLLRTKDWTGALYAELGIVPENEKVLFYTKVLKTNYPEIFYIDNDGIFIYEIGKEAVKTDVDENVMEPYAVGLHFTSLEFIDKWDGETILECEVNVEDILTIQNSMVRARKCKVIRIYKEE